MAPDACTFAVEELCKRYRNFRLGPVSFKLEGGRAYGLLGPNGAGKTTLLGSLSAQLWHEGTVRWAGRAVRAADWRLREDIAYLPEVPYLYEELTVSATLRLARGVFGNWDAAAAGAWQARLALDERKRVCELSKGMRTKLALLVAISHRARVLLLDEPTTGMDPESRRELYGHFRSLVTDCGVCLLLSSHLFEDIEMVADHIFVLRGGQMQLSAEMAQLAQARRYPIPAATLALAARCAGGAAVAAPNPEVIVWDEARLPDGLRAALGRTQGRAASLRDVYFALAEPGAGGR